MSQPLPLLPWPARALNRAGEALARGTTILPFDPALLMDRAARSVGLSDFAPDPAFSEGLDRLCRSIENDVAPTLLGRILLRDLVLHVLENRLLWVHHRRASPGRVARPIQPPLIVVGVPRSGTTLLHRLLALDEGARALPMWQLMRPFPPLGRDLRRAQGNVGIGLLRWAAGDLDRKHFTSGESAEECMLLHDASLVSLSFWVFAPVYDYIAWWRAQDKTGAYTLYRETLAWLQADTPGARFTLKAPVHTGSLDALLAAVPNAMIVQTHRDIGAVIPSVNSLHCSIHATMTNAVDRRRVGETNAAILLQMLEDNTRFRAARRPAIVDVRYDDLTRDPVAVIRHIYADLGLSFTATFEVHLRRALAEDRHGREGRHVYAAEDYGQTEDELRARFAPYTRAYLDPR